MRTMNANRNLFQTLIIIDHLKPFLQFILNLNLNHLHKPYRSSEGIFLAQPQQIRSESLS
jgi:hypothetical protein